MFLEPLRRALLACIVMTVVLFSPPCLAQENYLEKMLNGARAKSDQHIEVAVQQAASRQKPGSFDVAGAKRLDAAADAAIKAGDPDKAIHLLNDARAADLANSTYPENLAYVYFVANQFKESAMFAQQALKLDPTRSPAWLLWGRYEASIGMTERASACFYLALHFAPDREKIRGWLRTQSVSTDTNLALAAGAALEVVHADRADSIRPTRIDPVFPLAPVRATDIDGFSSLNLSDSLLLDLRRRGQTSDILYKRGVESYMDGYVGGDGQKFQGAVGDLSKSAYLGNPDAPGLLGVILAAGYSRGGNKDVAPDPAEAKKLAELSMSRGGTFGYVALADLALRGQGETADANKALQLYEQGARKGNAVAERRLILISVDAKDPSVVAAAKASMLRAGIAPAKVAAVIDSRSNKVDPGFTQALCGMLSDQLGDAVRRGDRTSVTEVRYKAAQLGCK